MIGTCLFLGRHLSLPWCLTWTGARIQRIYTEKKELVARHPGWVSQPCLLHADANDPAGQMEGHFYPGPNRTFSSNKNIPAWRASCQLGRLIPAPKKGISLLAVILTTIDSREPRRHHPLSPMYMLSRAQLFATPCTVAHQAPLSLGFPRQEYWIGLPLPSPGDLPDPGIKPVSLVSPALPGEFFAVSDTWKALWAPHCRPLLTAPWVFRKILHNPVHPSTSYPSSPLLFDHSVVSNTFVTPWSVAYQAPLSLGFPT